MLLRSLRNRLTALASTTETQTLVMLALGAVTGILVGGGAIVFNLLVESVQTLTLGADESVLLSLDSLSWPWKLAIPAIGGLIVGPIVFRWASEARGHGVPEVMEAVHLREGVIRPRVAVAKTIASAITISSGGSVGREGPVVQIGAALGSLLGQLPHVSKEHRRTLVGCGAAAGIAATFNAPIAGAFFALEVILANFAIATFSPIVIASVTATAVSRAYFGNFPAFEVPNYALGSWAELLPCAVLGILCGLIAVGFVRLLYAVEDLFEVSRIPQLLRAGVGGLIVGSLLIISPHLYGTGFESIGKILQGGIPWMTVAALILLKPLACSITLGSGGSGGVFSPSLFIGAAVGFTFGTLIQTVFPGWIADPGPYALVGMGAVLAATTHTPVASILILFELTGDYEIILPLMLAVTLSTVGARLLDRDSVYTRKLNRKGVHLFGAPDDVLLSTYKARDVMSPDLPTIPTSAPFATVLDRFLASTVDELFVVDADGRLTGTISFHDVKGLVGDDSLRELVIAGDFANATVPTVTPEMTAAKCLQRFASTGRESLPVVTDSESLIPIGLVTWRSLIDLYDREVLRREMLGTYSHHDQAEAPALPVGHHLEEVLIPASWVGQTLRDLDLRRRTGITVLGIQTQGRFDVSEIADPERKLRAGDRLVVFSDHGAMLSLKQLAAKS